jgi:drug/metabolite transporter, DME family
MTIRTHVPVPPGVRLIAAAAIAWGTGGAIAALLHRYYGLGPVTVSFWRFAVAAVAASIVQRRPGQVADRAGSALVRWRATILTGCGLALAQSTYFAAVVAGGVAVGTVVTIGASPLLIAFGAHVALDERLTRRTGVATSIALVGLLLLVHGSDQSKGPAAPHPVLGVVLALVSAAAYSAVTLYARAGNGAADRGGLGATAGVFTVGAASLAPFVAGSGGVVAHHGNDVVIVAWLVFLGIVPTVLAYRWFFAGLATVPAATASVIALLEPVSAAVIAVVALGERLAPLALAGMLVLLGAVVVLARESGAAAPLSICKDRTRERT